MFEHLVPFRLQPSQDSRQMTQHWPVMSCKIGSCVQDWLKTHFELYEYMSEFQFVPVVTLEENW